MEVQNQKSKSQVGLYIFLVLILFFLLGFIGVGGFAMFRLNSGVQDISGLVSTQNEKIDSIKDDVDSLRENVDDLNKIKTDSSSSDIASSSKTSTDLDDKTDTRAERKDSELVSLDNDFNVYTDYVLGFTMKIPKEVNDIVPAGPSSDGKNTTVTVERKGSQVFITGLFDPWILNFGDVSSEAELDAFIKKTHNNSCALESVDLVSGSETTSSYTIKDTSELGESGVGDCFLNFVAGRFYSEKQGKAVDWAVGQDATFWKDGDSYDMEMTNSFEFLK